MKLSLTFEPFVKPQYKDFCVKKIQHTVAQIKQHFKFSLKQHIYQEASEKQNSENIGNCFKSNAKDRASNDLFNKTVKKQPLKKNNHRQESDQDHHNTTENIKFFHLLQNKELPSKSQSQNLSIQPSQQLIEQQQLVGFLQKVESALGNHTNFYQSIMQKIEQMNRKQLQLEKIIENFKRIQKEKSKSSIASDFLLESDRPQMFDNIDYMTFRDHQFVNGQKNHETCQNSLRSIGKRKTAKFQSDSQQEIRQSKSQKPQQIFSAKSSSRNNPTFQNSQTYDLKGQDDITNPIELNGISQNADFLISFMKLQQQFNKIKKKSQFKFSEDSPKRFNKNPHANTFEQNSRIQLTFAH